jgi:hypothetical protein
MNIYRSTLEHAVNVAARHLDDPDDRKAVREWARTATEFGNNYDCGCPLSASGLYDVEASPNAFPDGHDSDYSLFVDAFDEFMMAIAHEKGEHYSTHNVVIPNRPHESS